MNINLDEIAGFDAAAEEIREVYIERDSLRDEVEALRQFKADICEVLGVGKNSHNDGVVKLLKANKARTSMDVDENRMYQDILDEIKTYFKMTASHWTYSDIPHFVKTAHEFALEKKEDAEDALSAFREDICDAIEIRKDAHNDTIIKALKADLSEAKRLRESVDKQEDFTEEAADILGVHPGDLTLSDVLDALRKLKRYEELSNMNCEIIANLKTELDQSQRAFSGEHSRRLAAEKYISDTFQRSAKELGMTCIPDGIDTLCDEIADLRNYRNRISCPKEFWEAVCDVMEMNSADATPSDAIGMTLETKKRLISLLALNPDTATWTDIYDGIKAEQRDHCSLITESYKMRNELSEFAKARKAQEKFTEDIATVMGIHPKYVKLDNVVKTMQYYKDEAEGLRNTLDQESEDFNRALRKADEEALRQMRESYICIIKQIGGGDSPEDENLAWYEHRIIEVFDEFKKKSEDNKQSHVFRTVCSHLGLGWWNSTLSEVTAAIDDLKSLEDNVKKGNLVMVKQLEQDKKFLKGELDHTDERRRHWVRRYKEEHERAVSLDKLYREWKDKYETYYEKTSNVAEQNESLMASYMAVKNTAIKQKDILKIICRYLAGKDNLPDKDIVVRLNEMWTKENGWDGLVKHYGKKAIGELIDACDDEITETTRKNLGEMLK